MTVDYTDVPDPVEIVTTKGVALSTRGALYTYEHPGEALDYTVAVNTYDTSGRLLSDQYGAITSSTNLSRSNYGELGFGRARWNEADDMVANYLYQTYTYYLADLALRAQGLMPGQQL